MTPGARDTRVDAYIAAARPFARPILERLRDQLHAACPAATETIRWSMPFFDYHGRPLAHMAAFKAHAAFGFWRGRGDAGASDEAMGQFGRLTSPDDLPAAADFAALVHAAMARTDGGAPAPRAAKPPKAAIETPADLAAALAGDAAARTIWEGFPPGGRREYARWIADAGRPETRAGRVATTLAQLAEGKRLNWKYGTGRGDRR